MSAAFGYHDTAELLDDLRAESAWQRRQAARSICRCNSASEEPCRACQDRDAEAMSDEGDEFADAPDFADRLREIATRFDRIGKTRDAKAMYEAWADLRELAAERAP